MRDCNEQQDLSTKCATLFQKENENEKPSGISNENLYRRNRMSRNINKKDLIRNSSK